MSLQNWSSEGNRSMLHKVSDAVTENQKLNPEWKNQLVRELERNESTTSDTGMTNQSPKKK